LDLSPARFTFTRPWRSGSDAFIPSGWRTRCSALCKLKRKCQA
jgi:hypothetical protein